VIPVCGQLIVGENAPFSAQTNEIFLGGYFLNDILNYTQR
jgi:hypothetical protein